MRMTVYVGTAFLLAVFVACTPKADQGSPAQSPTPTGPAKGFDIKVTSVERVKEWRPTPKGVRGLLLVRGVSLVMGQGFTADAGYELAVVHMNIKRVAEGATLALSDVVAIDDKGEKHSTVYQYEPLGEEAEEPRDFIFPVKTGTSLKKIQLAPDVSIDLP
ncbi:MAG TPA: hypothetical protein VFZ40_02075 [Pyrinomonadaceae bacterium]